MGAQFTYPADHGWLDDLRLLVKDRRESVTAAAQNLGISRATAYRIINRAKAAGAW